jgi:hypothetical protein
MRWATLRNWNFRGSNGRIAETRPIGKGNEPILKEVKKQHPESLSPGQLFGLALGGVLSSQNQSCHHRLYPKAPTQSNISQIAETIARDWGIRTRDDLIGALKGLTADGGQNQEFMSLSALLGTFGSPSRSAFINAFRKDPEHYAKLTIVDRAWHRLQGMGIFAWDCGRYIMLCRWGAMIGLLDDGKAWHLIMQMAGKVQPMFPDWYSYGLSYITGRHFWNANLSAKHATTMMAHVQQLFIVESGPWSMPWDVEL